MPSAMCSSFEQLVYTSFAQETSVMLLFLHSTEGSCLSEQLVCAAFTQETTIEGQQNSVVTTASAILPF